MKLKHSRCQQSQFEISASPDFLFSPLWKIWAGCGNSVRLKFQDPFFRSEHVLPRWAKKRQLDSSCFLKLWTALIGILIGILDCLMLIHSDSWSTVQKLKHHCGFIIIDKCLWILNQNIQKPSNNIEQQPWFNMKPLMCFFLFGFTDLLGPQHGPRLRRLVRHGARRHGAVVWQVSQLLLGQAHLGRLSSVLFRDLLRGTGPKHGQNYGRT